ncbi:MAG: alanine racemase [Treponema sp.]|jgi:alanine racemase|nr:alanine racemase [Treponema sp.]
MRALRALVHLGKFRRNVRAVLALTGRRVCVPVKAGAYGHGAPEMARAALEAGASCLAVALACEGAELREAGIDAPVLLLSQCLPCEIPDIIRYRLCPLVSDRDFALELARAAETASVRLPVHLKIDTGMGRLGCSPEEAPGLALRIAGLSSLELAGTATHLAVSDSAAERDRAYTKEQLARFSLALAGIREAGVDPGIVHAANSGGVVLHPESWFDMVRPGIFLYGYDMTGTAGKGSAAAPEPVMELRSRIVFIRKLKKGESVSYGRIWSAPRDTVIAVIPAGYADGIPRLLGERAWEVSIRGRRYPLAGRICMDQCMVDLGPGAGIPRWEEVSIFGGDAPGAGELAARVGTIPYEITCHISGRVPRVYVD